MSTNFTTRLLEELDDRMPRRQRLVLAGVVAFIALGSVAQAIIDRPARAAPPPPIVLIATPTRAATPARGLAKVAAPLAAKPAKLEPTTPAPTVEQPAVVFVQAPAPAPQPTPTAPPLVPTLPVTVYTWRSDGTLLSVYQCKPYGDWRDTDPMYVHPECAPERPRGTP